MEMIKISEWMEQSGVGFGTSGARGSVEAMTNEVCYAYTRAFIQAMEQQGYISVGAEIVLAGDLRDSTPRILSAVSRAITDAGYVAIFAGTIPSPAVACYAMSRGAASIMVTGSHIPDDRNGIKFNRPDGEILKQDENAIREQQVAMPEPFPAIEMQDLPSLDESAAQMFESRFLDYFPSDCLKGAKVGLYEHSGVARDLLYKVLYGLGAEVVRLARSEVFIPVDTEAIRPEDVDLAKQWSAEHGFDAIVSTDGDGDRPLISDEKGNWLRGDIVGMLCAQHLGIQKVVTPVSSNTAVEACGSFKEVTRTRIGSPFVIEAMNQALESEGTVAGYEANGGFLLASDLGNGESGLSALPTRDAILPILAILVAARSRSQSISALLADLPQRFTASDRLKAFPTEQSRQKIEALAASSEKIEQSFGNLCGSVSGKDSTDGLRITFENGEIVHLRPSGNAPELRCYNEAASPERAIELNVACLKILSGWRE